MGHSRRFHGEHTVKGRVSAGHPNPGILLDSCSWASGYDPGSSFRIRVGVITHRFRVHCTIFLCTTTLRLDDEHVRALGQR